MRLAIVNLVQTPYREPLYTRLSSTPGLTTRLYYLQTRDSVRGWSGLQGAYNAPRVRCLTPERLYPIPILGAINPGLLAHLRHFQPDCLIIHGYSYFAQIQVMQWAIRRRIPYLLWGDSNSHQVRTSGLGAGAKAIFLRYFCRHAAGALTIGALNEQFWSKYGIEPARQFRSPLAVDNDFFCVQAAHWRKQKATQRATLGLPQGRILLFVGRFAPEKNLEMLLRALAVRRRAGDDAFTLLLVGDGPQKPRLLQVLHDLNLTGVHVVKFQPQQELPKFYGIADALILPSSCEPWGLVVNEAMASGLPVLLSQRTGCRPDLLQEGENGFSFDESSEQSITAALERFGASSDDELLRMGARSAERIRSWSYDQELAGIFRALESTVHFRLSIPALHPVS